MPPPSKHRNRSNTTAGHALNAPESGDGSPPNNASPTGGDEAPVVSKHQSMPHLRRRPLPTVPSSNAPSPASTAGSTAGGPNQNGSKDKDNNKDKDKENKDKESNGGLTSPATSVASSDPMDAEFESGQWR